MTSIEPQTTTEISGRPVTPGPSDQSAAPAGKANYVTGIADGNLATPVKLRDFLFGLGVVYRLPKKAKEKPAEGEGKRRFAIRIPVKQIALGLAPVVLAVAGYFGYQEFSGQPLPASVVGTWSTQDGRYKGRNFWLNPEAVAFQNGTSTSQFSVHPIKKVKTYQSADTLVLNIDYEADGKAATLSLSYRDLPRPELRLVNQPKIQWLRTGNAPVVRQ